MIKVCKQCKELKKCKTKFCSLKCYFLWQKENGIKPPSQLGYKHTPETRKKISLILLTKNMSRPSKFKGKKRPAYIGKKISATKKGILFSPEHKKKLSMKKRLNAKRGEQHPMWKGGVTPITYKIRHSIKYKDWVQDIFRRDDFVCHNCTKRGGRLEIHHIIPFSFILQKIRFELGIDELFEKAMAYPLLWDPNNGMTLCEDCHKLTDTYGKKAINYQLTT